ncbi:MAG TPA: beta-galactosidase small subunit, partial [Bacteroidales bacterium]|nr:beta-galactosidase small subunit [Bacteroidales bacterium]
AQFFLAGTTRQPAPPANRYPFLEIRRDSGSIILSNSLFRVSFDQSTGTLTSWNFSGTELITAGPLPNFRRAPTDNDIGNRMFERCKPWFDASENRRLDGLDTRKSSEFETVVTAQYTFPDEIATETVEYRIQANGKITITTTLKPLREKLPEIPRFGLNMRILPEFRKVTWYGRGPWENYCDRKTASYFGIYSSTPEELFTPYVRPQENGYRTEVRWATFTTEKGLTLKISGAPDFCFSALPYTYDDLKGFKQGGKHLHDLVKRDFIDLNIDYGQMGVGGDDSWGARTHEQYTLPAKEYRYTFTMEGIR